jgi:hypothetical protein
MKVYSDRDLELDILNAMRWPVYGSCSSLPGRLRVRRYGWDVALHNATSKRHHNTGTHGAGDEGAATYDDYGRFIAALFAIDPNARIAYYDGADDFHVKTAGKYRQQSAVSP